MHAIDTSKLREGMVVRMASGKKMGQIVAIEDDHLIVRQGFFTHTEIAISIADIVEMRGDDVIVLMRGTIPGEMNEGRNSGSRGLDVAEREHDTRLL